jgi:hypothetical protein
LLAIQRKTLNSMPIWRGWVLVIILPAAVFLLDPAEWPRWLFMWVLAYAIRTNAGGPRRDCRLRG